MRKDPTPEEWDTVNRPKHYNVTGIECIDYIQQQLGDEFGAYCLGEYDQVSTQAQVQKQRLEKTC
jgi:anti-sigma factor ChrR (cupin superfamily)